MKQSFKEQAEELVMFWVAGQSIARPDPFGKSSMEWLVRDIIRLLEKNSKTGKK